MIYPYSLWLHARKNYKKNKIGYRQSSKNRKLNDRKRNKRRKLKGRKRNKKNGMKYKESSNSRKQEGTGRKTRKTDSQDY